MATMDLFDVQKQLSTITTKPSEEDVASALGIDVKSVNLYDEKIDDGDDNGGYVMVRCFTIEMPDQTIIARFYYGSEDEEVGNVDCRPY